MKDQNIAVGIIVFLGVIAGSFLIFNTGLPKPEEIVLNQETEVQAEVYVRKDLGLSFNYPDEYTLAKEVINNSQRYHETIILADKDFELPEAGEGPTAITIDVFQNNLDKQTGREFIEGSSFSNYKLSPNGIIEQGLLNYKEAYRYFWEGLYNGESIVLATPEYIYMFSVTYLDEADKIRQDFYRILETVEVE